MSIDTGSHTSLVFSNISLQRSLNNSKNICDNSRLNHIRHLDLTISRREQNACAPSFKILINRHLHKTLKFSNISPTFCCNLGAIKISLIDDVAVLALEAAHVQTMVSVHFNVPEFQQRSSKVLEERSSKSLL